MNSAHFHLMLVHIPVILVPFGGVLLLISIWRKSEVTRSVALGTFAIAAVFAGAAYLLGEGAEEMVEDVAGVVKSAIDLHEDSAAVALWATIVLGILSIAHFGLVRIRPNVAQSLIVPLVILSLASAGSLAYTAQQGGMIRHPEAFSASLGAEGQGAAGERDGDDD